MALQPASKSKELVDRIIAHDERSEVISEFEKHLLIKNINELNDPAERFMVRAILECNQKNLDKCKHYFHESTRYVSIGANTEVVYHNFISSLLKLNDYSAARDIAYEAMPVIFSVDTYQFLFRLSSILLDYQLADEAAKRISKMHESTPEVGGFYEFYEDNKSYGLPELEHFLAYGNTISALLKRYNYLNVSGMSFSKDVEDNKVRVVYYLDDLSHESSMAALKANEEFIDSVIEHDLNSDIIVSFMLGIS
ncbi:hypothetical protein [Shewanella sp. KJ2020]|uniref:hypothetical protein n=1 Tax=Shewanella sp. KJ2020 TaxID=2919172 RepID=UPI0020A7B2CF|nr:hypothetical protein [Shewanella sp. KJ2020]MCP3128409.1 hypothetical protein [Shewanella sp. KJ2020]